MPYTQHPHGVGVPSYRDEQYKDRGWPLGARWTSFAHGIKELFDDGSVDRNNTHGDILGSVFVKPNPEGRPFGSWFHACPVIKSEGSFFPIRDSSFAPDTSFEPIEAKVINDEDIPNNTPCIILCATKEDGEQELVVMTGGETLKLIAANRNSPYEMGTSVYDLNSEGEADISNQAKLQSAWKVMTPSYSQKSGSAAGNANFFALAAQGKNIPVPKFGKLLLKGKGKNNGNTADVGIDKDGKPGQLKFTKNGKQIDPFGLFGIGKQNKLHFGSKQQGGTQSLLTAAPGLVPGLLKPKKPKVTS